MVKQRRRRKRTRFSMDPKKIHRILLERADRNGGLRVVQKELADELGISVFSMCRIFKNLEESHHIRKIRAGFYAIRT